MITPFGELPDRIARELSMQEQHDWFQRSVTRRQAVAGLTLGVTGLGGSAAFWRQPTRSSAVSSGIGARYITFGADPESELVIEYAVAEPFGAAIVRLRAPDGNVRSEPAEVHMVPGSSWRYCRARFDRLPADTEFSYEIMIDGITAKGGIARTSFEGVRPFRFTAFGDQGILPVSQSMVARVRMLQPAVHLLCGDLCYADSSGRGGPGDAFHPHHWDAWLAQNEPATSRVPWLSVPGNHEMEPGFGMHGYAGMLARVSPGGRSPLDVPVALSCRIGNVGFVGLDSNDVSYEIPANRGWTRGAQTRWLERTLAAFRADASRIDFIVAFMHHAPYSTNSTHACEGGVLEEWVPLFDRYAVDLVISGHNHCFERTKPIRKGQVMGTGLGEADSSLGTTYVTAGGGGQGGETRFIEYPNMTRIATVDGPEAVSEDWSLPTKSAVPAVLVADVEPGNAPRMRIQIVTADGRVIDSVTLKRRAAARNAAAEWEPWAIGAAAGAAAVAGTGAAIWYRRAASRPEEPAQ